jgi:hypothetical protein
VILKLLEGEMLHLIPYHSVQGYATVEQMSENKALQIQTSVQHCNVPARKYQQAFVVVVNAEGCSDIGHAPLKLQHSLSLSIIL